MSLWTTRCETCKTILTNNPKGFILFSGLWYCAEECIVCTYEHCISTTKIFVSVSEQPMHPECQAHAKFIKRFGQYDPTNLTLEQIQFLTDIVKHFDTFAIMYEYIWRRLPIYDGDIDARLWEMRNPIEIYQLIASHKLPTVRDFGDKLLSNIGIAKISCQICRAPLGENTPISMRKNCDTVHPECARCCVCNERGQFTKLPYMHVRCARCPCGKQDGILINVKEEFWHVVCYFKKLRPDLPHWIRDPRKQIARENKFLRQFVPDIVRNRHYAMATDFVLDIPDIEIGILRNLNLRDAVMFMTVFRVPINNHRLRDYLCAAHPNNHISAPN